LLRHGTVLQRAVLVRNTQARFVATAAPCVLRFACARDVQCGTEPARRTERELVEPLSTALALDRLTRQLRKAEPCFHACHCERAPLAWPLRMTSSAWRSARTSPAARVLTVLAHSREPNANAPGAFASLRARACECACARTRQAKSARACSVLLPTKGRGRTVQFVSRTHAGCDGALLT
jgi:hypothetical protein